MTLAPDHAAGLVTSQRATVTAVDPAGGCLVVRTDDDRQVTLGAGQLGPDRLGHAYATTVHHFQGSTVDRTHLYADGGGRELAYVAMSRARHASSVYVVADDLDQAREDLARDWATRRTPIWAIDTALPAPEQVRGDPRTVGERERAGIVALRHAQARLLAAATHPGRPPAPSKQAEEVRAALAQARQRLADLDDNAGAHSSGAIGEAARHAHTVGARLDHLERVARAGGWRERRQARRELPDATAATTAAEDHLDRLVTAERGRLQHEISRLHTALDGLDRQTTAAGQRWQQAASQHAAATQGQRRLGRILQGVRQRLEQPDRPARAARPSPGRPTPGHGQPTPRHVLEPDPPDASREAPGL